MTTRITHKSRDIERTVLPNGIRVVTERMPHVRSVSVGVWIGTGSREESLEQTGISHFIEHMLFKGTTHRSAEQIARDRSTRSAAGSTRLPPRNWSATTSRSSTSICREPSISSPIWCATRASIPPTSTRKKAWSWKSSRWRSTTPSTSSTRFFRATSGRGIVRTAHSGHAPDHSQLQSATTSRTIIGITTRRKIF